LARRFYLGSSLVFLALVFLAFIKSYYLKFLFDTPALSTLVHVHGVVMSGWVALLVVQSGLVAAHRVQWHRRLGVFGTGWAALVAAAVWLRRRTDHHKRLMFLTIICLLP
jgi:hypothetical protein